MMPAITRGAGARGLIRYLSEDGRVNEHTDQRIIDGSLGQHGDLSDKAFRASIWRDLDAPKRAYPQIRTMHQGKDKPIWHCSLSLKAGEPAPTDEQWSTIARDFLGGMGFPEDSRWVVAAHGLSREGNAHVHIAASLITESGQRVNTFHDYRRSQKECTRLETKYGLTVLESRLLGVSTPGLTQLEVNRQRQTGEIPARLQLRDKIRAAYGGAASEAQFFDRLRTSGVQVKTRRDQGGSVTGYAVALPTQNLWFPGATLGHDLTLESLRRNWKQRPTEVHPNAVGGRPRVQTYKQAEAEIQRLTAKLPTLDPRGLADAAHTLSGALAATGNLDLARTTAQYAGARHTSHAVKRVALTSFMAVMAVENQDASPGQQAVIRSLVRAAVAVQAASASAARRRRPEGGTMTDQETRQEVRSSWWQRRQERIREGQLRIDERAQARAAQDRRPWDAKTIAQYRIADDIARNHPNAFQERGPIEKVDAVQANRIVALGTELYRQTSVVPGEHMTVKAEPTVGPTMELDYVNTLDRATATALERKIEFGLGAEKVAQIDARLAGQPRTDDAVKESVMERMPAEMRAKVRETDLSVPGQRDTREGITARAGMKPAEQWATGAENLRPAQRGSLLAKGYSPADIDTLTKAAASMLIEGRVTVDQARDVSEQQRANQPKQQAGQSQQGRQPEQTRPPQHDQTQQRRQQRGA